MNKFAQQLTDDIVEMAMYKIACWAKLADAEPPAPAPEQQPQPAPQQPQPAQAQGPQPQPTYPTNIREMSPRRAAEAAVFEHNVYHPMMRPDYGEKDDIATISPVTGYAQGMPQRYADTAMESAAGMSLPRPPATEAGNQILAPIQHQGGRLKGTPYGGGFYNDIGDEIDNILREDLNNGHMQPSLPNPGRDLRRQQNFY